MGKSASEFFVILHKRIWKFWQSLVSLPYIYICSYITSWMSRFGCLELDDSIWMSGFGCLAGTVG